MADRYQNTRRAYFQKWYAANREKHNADCRARWTANREKYRAARLQWEENNPHRVAYHVQKGAAKYRGIPFFLSFDEWWEIWEESGKWDQRGKAPDQYCMARFGDDGPYAIGNVRICTTAENCSERNRARRGTKYKSKESRHSQGAD